MNGLVDRPPGTEWDRLGTTPSMVVQHAAAQTLDGNHRPQLFAGIRVFEGHVSDRSHLEGSGD